jgi:predicted ATPase/class 3 adenylate cyclase
MADVARCPACDSEIAEGVNFCPTCGARLAPPGAETRRQVTILFCDLVASTFIGTTLDSEVMRVLLTRFFDGVKEAVERHGGTVEKFIGDAAMAVFGLPELHEDDALRAVRAAIDVRTTVDALSRSVEHQFGRSLQVRMGINTGPVVAADDPGGQRLVTGEAVNLAARLEQAADPGEILIGQSTHKLVRQAVAAEPLPPLAVKGVADLVTALRLLGLTESIEPVAIALRTAFVARAAEMDALRGRLSAGRRERRFEMVTVVGSAGIGKSRLVHEFLAEVGNVARILRGRCLPYGEGITYWPISLIVKAAAGIEDADDAAAARRRLDSLAAPMVEGGQIADTLAAAIGLGAATSAGREQIGWAFRRFLEGLARDRPLIVVVDDIQWGDPTLLDLLESTAALSSDAAILLLCLARPEIAELRPGWSTGLPGALTIELEPLTDAASESLIEALANNQPLPSQTVRRLREAAEGNPLFLEELLAMFVEEGSLRLVNGRWEAVEDPRHDRVPPTVQAVLAARLDRLPDDDRAVAQRAAVVGRTFERGAVVELSPEPDRSSVERNLVNLVRKEVIRPDARGIAGDETFRFRHLLVRDAAYERLSKQERSELHHRFADWLERTAGERLVEFEEIVGYHLEQAFQYRQELGQTDDFTAELAERAGGHLAQAAGRAWDRSDFPAVASLLRRTMAAIGSGDARWPEWAADRVDALVEMGDEAGARNLLAELDAAVSTSVVPGLKAWAAVARANFESLFGAFDFGAFDPSGTADRLAEAIEDFGVLHSERGLARAWLRSALVPWLSAQGRDAGQRVTSSLEHAQRTGRRGDEVNALAFLTNVMVWGPAPVPEARRTYAEVVGRAGNDRRLQAHVSRGRAVLLAMEGHFGDAHAEFERCVETFQELGLAILAAESAQLGAFILGWGDRIADAASLLTRASADLVALKEQGFLSTHRALLARYLVRLGRLDEAEAAALAARDMDQTDDLVTEAFWRSGLAIVYSKRGESRDADRLSQEAVELVQGGDCWVTAEVLVDRAEVLTTAGQAAEATEATESAIAIYRDKGATALVERLERARTA